MEKTILKKFLKIKNKLNSSLFSDELDKIKFNKQILINWNSNNNESFFGIIRTITIENTKSGDENISKGLGFLETLNKNEILFVKGSNKFAYFGELMTRLSMKKKMKGVVIYGKTRDSNYTIKIKNFTIFSKGYSPIDIKKRGKVKNTDKSFKIENVKIKSFDYIFADKEGVVIVPKKIAMLLYRKLLTAIKNEENIKKLISKNVSVKIILNKFKEF